MRTPKAHQSTARPYRCSSRICKQSAKLTSRGKTRAYLWRHELWRTTECARRLAIPHLLFTQTVIGDFDMTIQGQQDVVELEISIDDAF